MHRKQKRKNLKISIPQRNLEEMIRTSAIGALSLESQTSKAQMGNLLRSIKINATENSISFESMSDRNASCKSISVSKENGINVKEIGTILIPAKELIDWVMRQGSNSVIDIVLKKTDKTAKASSDTSRSGMVKLTAKDSSKTNTSWEVVCYDPSCFSELSYQDVISDSFEILPISIMDAMKNISLASLKEHTDVWNGFSLQKKDGKLYFMTSDSHQCALYQIPEDSLRNVNVSDNTIFIVPISVLDKVMKSVDKEQPLTISYSDEAFKLYISQGELKFKVGLFDRKEVGRFPRLSIAIGGEYTKLVSIQKPVFQKILSNASMVNKSSAQFSFNKNEGILTVTSMSENGNCSPSVSASEIKDIMFDAKKVWRIDTLTNIVNAIQADDIEVLVEKNDKKILIRGLNNVTTQYVSSVIRQKKHESN